MLADQPTDRTVNEQHLIKKSHDWRRKWKVTLIVCTLCTLVYENPVCNEINCLELPVIKNPACVERNNSQNKWKRRKFLFWCEEIIKKVEKPCNGGSSSCRAASSLVCRRDKWNYFCYQDLRNLTICFYSWWW